MMSPADLPETLALFPLPGAVLLPGARLPLHIFEPRYLQMLDDALRSSHRLIGMVQPLEAPGAEKRLHAIGCAGRVTQFSETEDGRYMITLTGISRYRIQSEIDGFSPYRRASVSWDGFEVDFETMQIDKGFDRPSFLELLEKYFDAQSLSTDWGSLKEAEDDMLINSLSMLCPFDPEEKQALLEAPSLSTRRETLITLIEFALRSGETGEILQ